MCTEFQICRPYGFRKKLAIQNGHQSAIFDWIKKIFELYQWFVPPNVHRSSNLKPTSCKEHRSKKFKMAASRPSWIGPTNRANIINLLGHRTWLPSFVSVTRTVSEKIGLMLERTHGRTTTVCTPKTLSYILHSYGISPVYVLTCYV